jgi:ribose transport system substrate-binding protein
MHVRNNARRRSFAPLIALLAVVVFVLAGCVQAVPAASPAADSTDSAATSEDPIRIAYFTPLIAHDWARVSIESATATAEEQGATVEVFDSGGDPAKQYAQVQDAVTSGRFDGFVIMANDSAGIVPAIEESVEAGIKVVDVAFAVGPDLTTTEPQVEGMVGSVVISPRDNGGLIAQIITEGCKDLDPCNVALLPGSLTVSADATRVARIREVLADYPNVNLVAVQETGYTEDGAYGVAKDILLANPDLHMFSSIGSESIAGAERAVIEAGREGEILLGGGGCSKNATDNIRAGRWFACYRASPIEDNRAAVEMIIKAIRGETIEDRSINAAELAGWPPVVTAETIGDLEGQWTD